MKLHESHRMGTIEGVKCCLACYAEPWWPLAEQRCTGGGIEEKREKSAKMSERIAQRRANGLAVKAQKRYPRATKTGT